jgi:hypothetical protein
MTSRRAVAGFLFLALMGLLVIAAGGCSPAEPPSLSPTPEQDPERHERARRAEEQAKRRNQEAEKILMKKRHTKLPVK